MYCRLCLNKFRIKELISILSFTDGLDWKSLCWEYLRIRIKQSDIYSKGICQKCSKVLKEFHIFYQHSQHCLDLLPQFHLNLKETGVLTTSEQNAVTQTVLNENINSDTIEFQNNLDVYAVKSLSNSMTSELANQKSIFVITETLENETYSTKDSIGHLKRARTTDEEDETTIVVKKEPFSENILPDTQVPNAEFQTTFSIKTEPLENDQEIPQIGNLCTDVLMTANESEAFKDENELFESTEYELHVPIVRSFACREESRNEFEANFLDNFSCNDGIQNTKWEQAYSESLQQVDNPFDLDEKIFRKTYRLSKDLAHFLIQSLDAQLRGTRITAISSDKLVLTALHFYATGSFHKEFGGVNMNRAIHKVTDAINARMCQHNIRFPMTSIERQAAKDVFASAPAPFIGAIGAIDCMHVAILAPTGEQVGTYLNEHGQHSINVQMICDPTLKILTVNARYPGSKDNAYIWNASVARSVMKRAFDGLDQFSFLIGNAKYPLEPWLMTPFSNCNKRTSEYFYNEALRKAHNPVQQLFGVLQETWRCLSSQRELKYYPQFAGRIVNACSILHNLQLSHQEFKAEDFISLMHPQHQFYIGGAKESTDSALLNTAKNIRHRIISNYYSNENKKNEN